MVLRRTLLLSTAFLLSLGASACTDEELVGSAKQEFLAESEAVSTELVELTDSGGCAAGFFWATTANDKTAVTVRVDTGRRLSGAEGTTDFTVPDPRVEVRVQEGRHLRRAFCTDVLLLNRGQPVSDQKAVSGHGTIIIAPPKTGHWAGPCGQLGTVVIEDLVAKDGTAFAPTHIETDGIGCFLG